MTLVLRTVQAIVKSCFQPKMVRVDEIVRDRFLVLPFDLDVYLHMNNAKYLNYLEASRWRIQLETRFLFVALKNGWIGPAAAIQIEYYRPLRLFQRFEVRSQFVGFEERWFYILQRFWRREDGVDKEVARALVKGGVRRGRENVAPETYLPALGYPVVAPEIPADVRDWVRARLG